MTLQQLRCFVAIAKNLNFARAAQDLYISQPAVTRSLNTLEQELGVRLVERTQKHVALTPAGRGFYADAVDILDRVEQASRRVQEAAGETLYVGCESSIQLFELPQIYREYKRLCPQVHISNTEFAVTDRPLLLAGKVDVLFLTLPAAPKKDGILYAPLFRGQFCCVVPAGHPLCAQGRVTAADLAHETLIFLDTAHCPPEMDAVQRELRLACPEASIFYSGSSLYTIPMIEGGLGLAVMPDFVCPPSANVVRLPFARKAPVAPISPISYGIAWHEKEQSETVLTFIRTVRAAYRKNKS
jgi:DNA-binding transcriptional LysR family regulator